MTNQAVTRNPFKGLDAFLPNDRHLFFGRDMEIAELYAAFNRSQILVVFGESGVGKTSLVQCGLFGEIPSEDVEFLPLRLLPDTDLVKLLRKELVARLGPGGPPPPLRTRQLLAALSRKTRKTVVLFLDQFEEFFLSHTETSRRLFVEDMGEWFSGENDDPDARVLLCLREEYLAKLTELEVHFPRLLENKVWVRPMGSAEALKVVRGPCDRLGVGLEGRLAENLVASLRTAGRTIELPILQVVLDRLYREAVREDPGQPVLTAKAYSRLGRLDSILADFIHENIVAHPDTVLAKAILESMISEEGTKILIKAEDVHRRVQGKGLQPAIADVDANLRRLVDERIVRVEPNSGLFELRHDALAAVVHNWLSVIDKKLLEVRSSLNNRFKEYQARARDPGALLDAEALMFFTPYMNLIQPEIEVSRYVEHSRDQLEQLKGRTQLAHIAWYLSGILGFVGMGILTGWIYFTKGELLTRYQSCVEASYGNRLNIAKLKNKTESLRKKSHSLNASLKIATGKLMGCQEELVEIHNEVLGSQQELRTHRNEAKRLKTRKNALKMEANLLRLNEYKVESVFPEGSYPEGEMFYLIDMDIIRDRQGRLLTCGRELALRGIIAKGEVHLRIDINLAPSVVVLSTPTIDSAFSSCLLGFLDGALFQSTEIERNYELRAKFD